jgi:hypothetical protein
MRPVIIGLFVAVLAVAFSPAHNAFAMGMGMSSSGDAPAKPSSGAKPLTAAPIDPDKRSAGKKDTPAIIKAANLTCKLADAQRLGDSVDPKTKVKTTFYEIACSDTGGFILATHPAPQPTDIYNCLEVAGSAAACILPANIDTKAPLAPVVLKLNPGCTVVKARGIGHASDGSETAYEVACASGEGYRLETSFPFDPAKPAKLIPCIAFAQTPNGKCALTDDAADSAFMDRLATQNIEGCVVKDRRYVGGDKAGQLYYEFACQNGKGYLLPQSPDLSIGKPIDCANTDQCQLTDTRQAENEQNGLYSKLALAGGFHCAVSKYAPFPVTMPKHEVVELACSDRPDGAVAIFAASSAEPAKFYDCAHAEMEGFRCSFSKPDTAVAGVTADLKKLGKDSCTVSSTRYVGITADKHGYLEAACADGLPGYTIEYTLDPLTPSQAYPCTAPPPVDDTCKLPTNQKKH